MREGLRGLTVRGRSFLAAAFAAGLAAVLLGEKDLLQVAVLLTVLPLLAAAHVGRSRFRLACHRTLAPHRLPVAATSRVILQLENLSRLPTGTLLLEDRLPYALGSRPRVVLERLHGQKASSVAYTVRPDIRGRYDIGPLTIRITDPFGLAELTQQFSGTDRLTVLPPITALPAVRLPGTYAGTGNSRARSVAVHGEDDAATRQYRRGDDLRRVHWKSTARTGELMVRREEQPWESRATVVLDTRAQGHRGEGPTSSFEWAVPAAASIVVHLRQAGYHLRLVTGSGADIDTSESTGDSLLLDHLAEVRTTSRTDLAGLVDRVRQRADGGLIIALLGALSPAEAGLLAGLRGNNATCIGFLLDSSSWLHLPEKARQEADQAHETATLTLLRSGWRVITASRGSKLAMLWPQAARGSQGFALRAALAETVAGGRG